MVSKEFDRLNRDLKSYQILVSQIFQLFASRFNDFICDLEIYDSCPEDEERGDMRESGLLLMSVCGIFKSIIEELEDDIDKIFGYSHIEY